MAIRDRAPPRLGRAVPSRIDRDRTRRTARSPTSSRWRPAARPRRRCARRPSRAVARGPPPRVRCACTIASLDAEPDAERAFAALFGSRPRPSGWTRSRVDPAPRGARSSARRPAGIGAADRYDVHDRRVDGRRAAARDTVHDESIFAYLSREVARRGPTAPGCRSSSSAASSATSATSARPTAAPPTRAAPSCPTRSAARRPRRRDRPRARARTLSRALRRRARRDAAAAEDWSCATAAALAGGSRALARAAGSGTSPLHFELRRGREHYLANIETCKALLAAGESYEVCLTNTLTAPAPRDTFALYRVLRRVNPAPYGAYLRLARRRGRELLARALPARRPRPRRRGEADQGHRAAASPTRAPTPAPASRARAQPEGRAPSTS